MARKRLETRTGRYSILDFPSVGLSIGAVCATKNSRSSRLKGGAGRRGLKTTYLAAIPDRTGPSKSKMILALFFFSPSISAHKTVGDDRDALWNCSVVNTQKKESERPCGRRCVLESSAVPHRRRGTRLSKKRHSLNFVIAQIKR